MMREYAARDVTDEAHRIAREHASGRVQEDQNALEAITPRRPRADSFVAARGRREESISARGRELILYGEQSLDLRYLEQLVDTSQTRAIAHAIRLASQHLMDGDAREPGNAPPTLA